MVTCHFGWKFEVRKIPTTRWFRADVVQNYNDTVFESVRNIGNRPTGMVRWSSTGWLGWFAESMVNPKWKGNMQPSWPLRQILYALRKNFTYMLGLLPQWPVSSSFFFKLSLSVLCSLYPALTVVCKILHRGTLLQPWPNAFGMQKYFSENYIILPPKLNEDLKERSLSQFGTIFGRNL